MQEIGRLKKPNGQVSKIIYKDTDNDMYIINEIDEEENVINSISLSSNEFDILHLAMSKIENY